MKRETGQSLMEFALISLVVVALVFGSIDTSLALGIRGEISQAAREGARLGSIQSSLDTTEIVATVKSRVHWADPDRVEVGVSSTETELTVSVSYTYQPMTTAVFDWPLHLEYQATARRER